MLKKYILWSSIIALLCNGCANEIDKNKNNELNISIVETGKSQIHYGLKISDTMTISVDSLTTPVNSVNVHKTLGQIDLLVDYNENTHAIQIYDLATTKKIKNIKLRSDGPFKIDLVTGIYFHNFDSIFLVAENENKIYLIDSATEIVNKWHVDDGLPVYGKAGYDLYIGEFFKPHYESKKQQLTIGLVTYTYFPNTIPFYGLPILLDYDVVNNKLINNYGYNPQEFTKDEVYFLMDEFNMVNRKPYQILNFFGSHNLYFYSDSTKKLDKIVKVKSKYLPNRIAGIGKQGINLDDMQMQSKYYIETGRYINFLHDSYRNVYYRLVKKPSDFLTVDGKQRSFDSFEYSIMILDSNLNISNEIDLEVDTYDFQLMFVDKKGLWISINNPNNKKGSEDEMKLVLFTLEENEK